MFKEKHTIYLLSTEPIENEDTFYLESTDLTDITFLVVGITNNYSNAKLFGSSEKALGTLKRLPKPLLEQFPLIVKSYTPAESTLKLLEDWGMSSEELAIVKPKIEEVELKVDNMEDYLMFIDQFFPEKIRKYGKGAQA